MSAENKIPTWLDCDPGHDDAFAILLLAHHPRLQPLGISTVHGNSSLPQTTHNALSLLTAFSTPHIPVFSGASDGLSRPAVHAPAIHGSSGLDGTSLLPTPTCSAQTEPAIDAMASALLATAPGTAWLVATGALTNIALLFQKYPEVAAHLKGVSIMGGAIGDDFTKAILGSVDGQKRVGNWSIWAEFNILVDPEAADEIFTNGALKEKITLIPLDVTHLVLATKEVLELLSYGRGGKEKGEKSTLRQMLVELLTFFAKTYADVFGILEGPPLHDPLAVAVVLGDEIVFDDGGGERFEVKVITEGSHEDALKGAQTGRTVVRKLEKGEKGVRIPRALDVGRFWDVLEECLERADEANKANKAV